MILIILGGCVSVCMCAEDRAGDVAKVPSTVLLGWNLPLALPSRLGWLSSEPQRSACLYLPSINFHAHIDTQLFFIWIWGSNSGLSCLQYKHFTG